MPTSISFGQRLAMLADRHENLLSRKNEVNEAWYNGFPDRYRHPVLTISHAPLIWRYDLDETTNPFLIKRMGVNSVFNPGAILIGDTVHLVCRMEGTDRKPFFAVAESSSGVDGCRFWPRPLEIPGADEDETNLYDMRLVRHEDGWIHGLFTAESHDASTSDPTRAVSQCGIARTRDLKSWERLPNLKSSAPPQRNVVLHPRFVDGRYGFHTRPQDEFVHIGSQVGIGWGTCTDIQEPVLEDECAVDTVEYHTVMELRNGAGPEPVRTEMGWLHIAHGVRRTVAGRRYVLYTFLCDLQRPYVVTHRPGGYLMAPWDNERVGDVSNVTLLQRRRRSPRRDPSGLLRFVRHARTCGDHDARPRSRLRGAYPVGRRHDALQRARTRGAHRAQRQARRPNGMPAPPARYRPPRPGLRSVRPGASMFRARSAPPADAHGRAR